MASLVYSLCAVTSGLCTVMLVFRYRSRRDRLILWTALCFCGLTINNVLLFADYVVVPAVDLSLYRSGSAAAAMIVMVAGLIWES
ncbi:hypothetical protein BH18ACI5_BH18ACI5_18790 [soil metagenome]